MQRARTYVITGATGFLGQKLTRHLLADGDRLIIVVRGGVGITAQERVDAIFNFSKEERKRVYVIDSDISDIHLIQNDYGFQNIKNEYGIDGIWHLAANLSFRSRDKDSVYSVNFIGTKLVAKLALELNTVLLYVSTAYVHGKRNGILREADLLDATFNNYYEHSKFVSEEYLRKEIRNGLQCTVFRPSILIDIAKEYNIRSSTFGYYAIVEVVYELSIMLRNFITLYPIISRFLGLRVDSSGVIYSYILPFMVTRTAINFIPVDATITVMVHTAKSSDNLLNNTFHVVSTNALLMREIASITLDELRIRMRVVTLPKMVVRLLFKCIHALSHIFSPLVGFSKKLHYYGYYMITTFEFDTTQVEQVYEKNRYRSLFATPAEDLRNAARAFIHSKIKSDNKQS